MCDLFSIRNIFFETSAWLEPYVYCLMLHLSLRVRIVVCVEWNLTVQRFSYDKMLCPICQRPETKLQKFYNHYGDVKCCLSCKAFFRRYLKESKKKNGCKFENKCDLHYTLRKKKCAHCRYERCLSVRMRKEFVFNDEELMVTLMCSFWTF